MEKHILRLFQEDPELAEKELNRLLKPTAAPDKRAFIRGFLSRLYINSNGRYLLKK